MQIFATIALLVFTVCYGVENLRGLKKKDDKLRWKSLPAGSVFFYPYDSFSEASCYSFPGQMGYLSAIKFDLGVCNTRKLKEENKGTETKRSLGGIIRSPRFNLPSGQPEITVEKCAEICDIYGKDYCAAFDFYKDFQSTLISGDIDQTPTNVCTLYTPDQYRKTNITTTNEIYDGTVPWTGLKSAGYYRVKGVPVKGADYDYND
jgi:hypothetical protein